MKDLDKLSLMAHEYNRLQLLKREITEQMKSLKVKINDQVPYKDTIKLNGLSIRRTSYKRNYFNTNVFKDNHSDLYSKYTIVTFDEKLIIKEIKK